MHLLYIHQVYLSITQSQPDVYNFCTIDKDNCLASTFLFVLEFGVELSAVNSHFKCEISILNAKIVSPTTSLIDALKSSKNQPYKSCSTIQKVL